MTCETGHCAHNPPCDAVCALPGCTNEPATLIPWTESLGVPGTPDYEVWVCKSCVTPLRDILL